LGWVEGLSHHHLRERSATVTKNSAVSALYAYTII
jgi:hypothetical protein